MTQASSSSPSSPAPNPTATSGSTARKRILSGIKPTGQLHLGNYAGAIRPMLDAARDPGNEVILMCVDWHALTDRNRMKEAGAQTIPMLAAYLTLGFNLEGNSLVLQSRLHQLQEITWYLACASHVGMLERAHAYKDAVANGKDATAGLFYYPLLMAADILAFDSDLVPVGKDQVQHLEMASDYAKYFNNATGTPVFKEPKPLLQDQLALLPGTDGRKMSKSYNNTVPLFATRKEMEKKVKEIKTDSKGLNDPKDPESCDVWLILRSFARPEALAHMAEKLRTGTGYGYGHAKMDFVDEYMHVLGNKYEEYQDWCAQPRKVLDAVEPGFARARDLAEAVRVRARTALGLHSTGA